jgi:hypothetical protein
MRFRRPGSCNEKSLIFAFSVTSVSVPSILIPGFPEGLGSALYV